MNTIFRRIKLRYNSFLINVCLPLALCNGMRVRILKKLGCIIEEPVHLYKGVKIRLSSEGGIYIGKGVSIGPGVLLDGRKGIEIGHSATIAYQAIIWTLNHDYNDIHFKSKGKKVIIGPYAWICSRSIILPGITVGEGAVVASGAIVTKDVAPYSIVAGIPAKEIGIREKKEYHYGYKLCVRKAD